MIFTQTHKDRLEHYLETHQIPKGLGDVHGACSIAAINLAISGELTDSIPDCMSLIIGKWIIVIQDAMPGEIRNSKQWKELLPLAAGTGRKLESERLVIILDWMWELLEGLQPLANKEGFGTEWEAMIRERSSAATNAAYDAAAAYAAAHAAAYAVDVTRGATANAVDAARAAAYAASWAAKAAEDTAAYWQGANPIKLLQKLIRVSF